MSSAIHYVRELGYRVDPKPFWIIVDHPEFGAPMPLDVDTFIKFAVDLGWKTEAEARSESVHGPVDAALKGQRLHPQ